MNRGFAAPGVKSFEGRLDERIKIAVAAEEYDSVLAKMQFDVAFEFDGTGEPNSGRHFQTSAAPFAQPFYGCLEGIGVECRSVTVPAKIGNVGAAFRESWAPQLRHIERQIPVK